MAHPGTTPLYFSGVKRNRKPENQENPENNQCLHVFMFLWLCPGCVPVHTSFEKAKAPAQSSSRSQLQLHLHHFQLHSVDRSRPCQQRGLWVSGHCNYTWITETASRITCEACMIQTVIIFDLGTVKVTLVTPNLSTGHNLELLRSALQLLSPGRNRPHPIEADWSKEDMKRPHGLTI